MPSERSRDYRRPIGKPATLHNASPKHRIEVEIDGQLWQGNSIIVTRFVLLGDVEVTRLTLTTPHGIVDL